MSAVVLSLVLVHLRQIAYTIYRPLFSPAHLEASDRCSSLPAVIVSCSYSRLEQLETSSITPNYFQLFCENVVLFIMSYCVWDQRLLVLLNMWTMPNRPLDNSRIATGG